MGGIAAFLILLLTGCAGESADLTSATMAAARMSEEQPGGEKAAASSEKEPDGKADEATTRIFSRDVGSPDRPGEDWPIFLGPLGTGVSNEKDLNTRWDVELPPLLWKKEIGTGYSAPSVRGNRLVMHHRQRNHEVIDCLRADNGDLLWRHRYPSSYSDPYGYNNGPRCSPLLTDKLCYTFGAEGMLSCLELETGKQIWARDIKQSFNINKKDEPVPNWFFGIGCSPVLEDGLLIALVGGQPDSGVVAFDAATGKTVWENVGKKVWDGVKTSFSDAPVYKWTGDEQVIGYSSPIVATIHGQRHLLCLVRQGLVSLDPKTGKVRFRYWFMSRAFESVNAARPLVFGDRIFLTAAYQLGSVLLEVSKDGNSVREVWKNPRNMLAHWSTPILVDGFIYGFSGRHEQESTLRCLEAKTGRVIWSNTGFDGSLDDLADDGEGNIKNRKTGKVVPWPFYGRGSKIRVGDHFIVLGERGTLALVKINPKKMEEIARTSFKEIRYPSWTAPVLSRKRLYLRSESHLLCLDLSPVKSKK